MPLLSGVLVATGYIPFPPWALPFCFVPLWLFWLREPSTRRVLWGGWLAQFVLCGAAFQWFPRTVHDFGGLPWAAAIAALALFAASGPLFLVLAGLLFAVLRERFRLSPEAQRALLPFVTAACWYSVPMLFPWNLGYPWFAAGFPAFQLAEFVGFEGLGLLTLLLNLALLAAWERRRERAGALLLAGTAGFLLLLNGAGALTASRLPSPDATARILAVQGNIGSVEKARAESREDARIEVLKRYLRLTRRGLSEGGGPPDFAVWPETAYPEPLDEGATGRGLAVVLREFLRGHALPLATGAPGTEADGVRRTNSMVFLGADGAIADRRYDKTRLLAFGERIPLEGTFPGIRSWLPRAGGFAPAPAPGSAACRASGSARRSATRGCSRDPPGSLRRRGPDLRQHHQRLLVRCGGRAVPAPSHDQGPGERVPPPYPRGHKHRQHRRHEGGRLVPGRLAAGRRMGPPLRDPVPQGAGTHVLSGLRLPPCPGLPLAGDRGHRHRGPEPLLPGYGPSRLRQGGVAVASDRGDRIFPPLSTKWLRAASESWQWPQADVRRRDHTSSVAFGMPARAALICATVSDESPVVVFAVVTSRLVVSTAWYRLFRWHLPQREISPG